MSNYYAVFGDIRSARAMINDLVQGGVRPDDLSLICRTEQGKGGDIAWDQSASVGDATVIVGREDDPEPPTIEPVDPEYTDYTTTESWPVGGIDTSNRDTDVDSVDQAEDSQELADEMTYPRGDVSNAEHQRESDDLSIATGFPTSLPVIDDLQDPLNPRGDELDNGLEAISIPGQGFVLGGGALATAALSFLRTDGERDPEAIVTFLKDDGVPEVNAQEFQSAFEQGRTIIGVTITPGEIDEEAIEQIAERHGADMGDLYDAPRYGRPNRPYVG